MVIFNRMTAGSFQPTIPIERRAPERPISEIESLGYIVESEDSVVPEDFSRIKRAFDIVFASVALLLLSPVILVAALMIRLESEGSIFYSQERIGLNRRRGDRRAGRARSYKGPERRAANDRRKKIHAGKPFNIYKLRTMYVDAEKAGPALSSRDDARITRVGRLLRRTRIDELPQFINVLRGEMSIVGPRPERSFFINQVRSEVPEFSLRLRVKPGITGLAQVENGYAETIEEMTGKLYYDLKYITGLSLIQELEILFKTVFVVISGKGAC